MDPSAVEELVMGLQGREKVVIRGVFALSRTVGSCFPLSPVEAKGISGPDEVKLTGLWH
jgi:hypothetical protein